MLQLRFAAPLAPFKTVRVELLETVMGTDGQSLKPWTLTFQTGSS